MSSVPKKSSFAGRPWLGVMFECCQVYNRIYKNKIGTFYTGRCPRCGKMAKVRVGQGGSTQRFFSAK